MKLKTIAQNQTEILTTEGTVIFFSYNTPVAAMLPSGSYVVADRKYSKTTSKHINKWLAGSNAETVSPKFLEGLV